LPGRRSITHTATIAALRIQTRWRARTGPCRSASLKRCFRSRDIYLRATLDPDLRHHIARRSCSLVMPAANATALASANPLSATNDLTIAHVMWPYDADAGFVVMKFVVMKNISDRNNAFFMRGPYLYMRRCWWGF
jgi:hypothetical protein